MGIRKERIGHFLPAGQKMTGRNLEIRGQPEETLQSGSIVFFKLFPERSAIDSEDSGRCGFVAARIGHNISNILGLNRFQGSVGLPDHKG